MASRGPFQPYPFCDTQQEAKVESSSGSTSITHMLFKYICNHFFCRDINLFHIIYHHITKIISACRLLRKSIFNKFAA